MHNIKTSIGTFDVSMPSKNFQCKENSGIICNEKDKLIIKSCLTRVVKTMQDGTEEYIEPIVMASCMNPDVISITPITYEETESMIRVSTPYKAIDICKGEVGNIRTEEYVPKLKKNSCIPCRNCGRC